MQIPRLFDRTAAVEVIRSYEAIENAKDQAPDDFVIFAARVCQTPMAFIAFSDGESFLYKSSIGASLTETPPCFALLSEIVDEADYIAVKDASLDQRFRSHPFVVSDPYFRFFAGVPLRTSEGIIIGVLFVADRIPRELSSEQIDSLWMLSHQIISRLELSKNSASISSPPGQITTTQWQNSTGGHISNKRIGEEFHESAAHNRIVAEMASEAIVTIDANSTILFANRATEEIFGYAAAELFGARLTMLMPESLRHYHEAGIRRFIETGSKKFKWQFVKVTGRRKCGEEFPMEISFAEYLENGDYYFTGVIRDVAERRRIVNALREGQERFRQLVEHVDEVFWLSRSDTNELIYISPGYAKIWGRPLESLYDSPRSWIDAVHPDDVSRVREAEILKQPVGDYDEEYRIVQPDGSIKWVRDRAFPIKNNDGDVFRIAGIAADITASKLMEGRLTTQYAVTRVLSEATTLTEATPLILRAVCENLDWKLGALWIVDDDSDEIYCVEIWQDPMTAANEFIAKTRYLRFQRDVGLPGLVWNTGLPKWIADIAAASDEYNLPRAAIADKEGLRSVFGFPIRLGREILGMMEFYSHYIRDPDEDITAMMSTIGSQIGQFVARKRAEETLRQANAELESRVLRRSAELATANQTLKVETVMRRKAEKARIELLRRLVSAHEEERGRISRELHDKMGQYLSELNLGLHSLAEKDQIHPSRNTVLNRLLQVTDELMRETHHLAWELRPALLDDLGLDAALGNYLRQWSERNGIELDFHSCDLDKQMLSPDIETIIYRIVQESLTNILKHAQAKNVSVIIEFQQNTVQVMVEDDGKGFDTEYLLNKATSEGRLGVVGMQERVAIVEGKLNIESTPGGGTAVFVRIPIPLAAVAGRKCI